MAAFAKVLRRALQAVLVFWLVACGRSPSEAQLLETLDAMHRAGEARDVSALMAFVADDFSGQSASLDRRDLGAFLLTQRLRTEQLSITRTHSQVRISDSSAEVELSFVVTEGRGVLPTQGQYVRVKTKWRFDGDDWLLTNANWEQGL